MCIFYFLNSNVFAFAIIEYKSLGDQEIFFPRGKKTSWSALASAWEDFLLFLGGWGGGARRLMRSPALTMLFLFAFVIRHTLCRQKLICKSVGQSTTQSIRGKGSKEVNEKSSTYHAVSICVHY